MPSSWMPSLPPVGAAVPLEAAVLEQVHWIAPGARRLQRTLLLADEPERVQGPGLLYADSVTGRFRVYLYALVDAPRPLHLDVTVSNHGTAPVTITLERAGLGGPGGGFFQVGQAAVAAWLTDRVPGRPLRIAPGRSVSLWPAVGAHPAARGQALNAMIDATASAPVEVRALALSGGRGDPESLLPPGSRPAALPMRGTFPAADLELWANDCVVGSGLRLGHPASYLVGYSAVDGRPVVNYGNYGVRYEIALSGGDVASGPASGVDALLFVPLGGGFCGAATIDGRPLRLSAANGRQIDARQALHLGRPRQRAAGAPPTALVWTPPAASYLPAAFVFV